MKYVVVTGGVVSGLGKGITISSIGVLFKACGLRVTSIKIDPYLNTDAGTMSPFEHGEVFVLGDGGEVDLDLGNYERFLDIKLGKDHNLTTGKVYSQVIAKERRGDYLGKTVQVVPHVTDAIQDWLQRVAQTDEADVCLVEVGGTVGDIESSIFLEALRQFQFRVGQGNFALVHVSLVPCLSGEQKSKPTQHGVKELRSVGLTPNLIVCRSENLLGEDVRSKIAMFCHVPKQNVIAVHNVPNIYHVPITLNEQKVCENLLNILQLPVSSPKLEKWTAMALSIDQPKEGGDVTIALVGKYTEGNPDAYLSVTKSLSHCGIALQRRVNVVLVESSLLDEDRKHESWKLIQSADGVLVPGGFGDRGFDGKVHAIRYCREEKKPMLGICLGMQAVVIEFARNVMGMKQANSTEFNTETPFPVVISMPELCKEDMGGTMRLGARTTCLLPLSNGKASLAQQVYGMVDAVEERHRHRYEVNPEFIDKLEQAGLRFTGRDVSKPSEPRMEIVELAESHPYFFGCQYHPEFQSYPHSPSPPFLALVQAAANELVLPFKTDKIRGVFDGAELEHDLALFPKSANSPKRTRSGSLLSTEKRQQMDKVSLQ
ncbi:CTP synthase [Batrachochytrium salamandrivorans]|nr:CTP synthase [Batrachochytrium salamandrivorans]